MRKILFTMLITIFSLSIFSNDHEIRPGNVVAEFHYFDVTDPISFVATVDKFDSSSCAQDWREKSGVNIGLYALGGGGHSHLILGIREFHLSGTDKKKAKPLETNYKLIKEVVDKLKQIKK